ncbi:MAG: TIR domain-containing protein [Balneola sp.]|nr:MAG: TIR domain-containing protein [Balneola sp.]
MSNQRVFLSYSYQDREKVDRIAHELQSNNIDIWYDQQDLDVGSNWNEKIRYQIESSDTVIIFLSKNFLSSEWSQRELWQALSESEKRNINIIPVTLERVKIPSDLSGFLILNLGNSEAALQKLIHKIKTIPEITFDHFTPFEFEKFVGDFLREYGFANIKHQGVESDRGFDFKAEYKSKTPFGTIQIQHWLVEVKFYRHERFSINSIQQLLEYKRHLLPADIKLLLVTNSILTSVVESYLNDFQKIENTQIEVIDGLLLKKLVAKRKRLLDKYFQI